MQKGLDLLLKKYSVSTAGKLEGFRAVKIDGKEYPLLPWESERKFVELKYLAKSRLGNPCTYRVGHTVAKGRDVFEVLRREAGVVEFTTGSAVQEVFAIGGESVLNAVLETKSGFVCTLEIAATLPAGEREIEKHEIITDNGVACDMVVDTQVPQSSVYVFGGDKKQFTDVDAELYGYTQDEAAAIRNAFALCKDETQRKHNEEQAKHLDAVVAAAKKSLRDTENIKVVG